MLKQNHGEVQMNAKIMKLSLIASMMVLLPACKGFHSAKNNGKASAAAPAKPTPPPAVDAQCPQNSEGLYEIKGEKPEAFGIGRNDKGILQMTFPSLVESVVLDGKTRLIGYKDGASVPTGTGAQITGKCVDSVIFVTVKNVVDKEGNVSVTELEYRLNADELTGNLTQIENGKKSVLFIEKSPNISQNPPQAGT